MTNNYELTILFDKSGQPMETLVSHNPSKDAHAAAEALLGLFKDVQTVLVFRPSIDSDQQTRLHEVGRASLPWR